MRRDTIRTGSQTHLSSDKATDAPQLEKILPKPIGETWIGRQGKK
jgi:hypothetical protein